LDLEEAQTRSPSRIIPAALLLIPRSAFAKMLVRCHFGTRVSELTVELLLRIESCSELTVARGSASALIFFKYCSKAREWCA
jgi:hypothetical protein